MESLYIPKFVDTNRNLFEAVNKKYENMHEADDVLYTILDYQKILTEMCEFVEGYYDYKNKGDAKYAGKVINTATLMYDKMFTNKNVYRKDMSLKEFRAINIKYIQRSKRLQDILQKVDKFSVSDREAGQLVYLTNNQYRKVAKVYKDDMEIYLWIISANSKIYNKHISKELHQNFLNKATPVMHKK